MPRKDFAQIAFDVVHQATQDSNETLVPEPSRTLSTAALAARAKGGKARADRLSTVEKKAIAEQGAASRWNRTPTNLRQSSVNVGEANPVVVETKAKRRIVF